MRTFRGGLLIGLAVAVVVAAIATAYELYDTRTLKRTIRRGEVLCGVNKGLPGFSIPDDKGNWTGFDVDFCRAVAAAIFDDPAKVRFLGLSPRERASALQSGWVDLIAGADGRHSTVRDKASALAGPNVVQTMKKIISMTMESLQKEFES